MIMYGVNRAPDVGQNSSDECCMCGEIWHEGQEGWILCDTDGCENTVCVQCTNKLSLIVSELFYCPLCAGSCNSAAASAGAAVASAVVAATELEKLPLSFKALQKVLSNLVKSPENQKYRKLRLENKKVKELFDFESVLNVLTSVGFVRKQCPREQQHNDNGTTTTSQTEEVLILEGEVHVSQIKDLLDVFEGLSTQEHADEKEVAENKQCDDDGKRKTADDTDTVDDAKKQRT
jgi:hypothetical protein